eukprot:m.56601 g.56601  ORF g.56601 m.56601 type:complete len:368 (-) comp22268_c0_seq1:369-1472(-)
MTPGLTEIIKLYISCTLLLISFARPCGAVCSERDWFRITRTGKQSDMKHCSSTNPQYIDKRDEAGCTALVNAAANKNLEMVRALLSTGADVNLACRSGNSALSYAAKYGDLKTCKLLHAHGADVDALVGASKQTPLDIAASLGHWDVVKYLHGVEVSLSMSWSGNELMFAAAKGEEDMIKASLAKGTPLENVDHHGNTALVWSARTGQVACVKLLLARGAIVNAASKSGWTALMQASYHGHLEVVKLLQLHGAAVSVTDKVGYAAIHWAAIQGHVEVLAFLHSVGADLEASASGWTPLMLAVQHTHVAATKYILRRGVSWTTKNRQGETCEALACATDTTEELCMMFKRMRETTKYEAKRQRHGNDL